MATSLYERLGVPRDADVATLRRAYRQRALQHHPDRVSGDASQMADINAAWSVLSDPSRRAAYDRSLPPMAPRQPDRPADGTRKDAWLAGIRAQMVRLGREAARSAAQALAMRRHGRPRALYEIHLDSLMKVLTHDTDRRVQMARQAGTAPLDLALASTLIGVRDMARSATREATLTGVDERLVTLAELLDKTWDNLAHGISRELEMALGANPRLLRTFTGRRV